MADIEGRIKFLKEGVNWAKSQIRPYYIFHYNLDSFWATSLKLHSATKQNMLIPMEHKSQWLVISFKTPSVCI